MKAIVYVRVSSQEQVSNLSLPLQERTCRDYCEGQGGALAFCSQILDRADRIWEESSLDQRQRFQRLVFPQGLGYSRESGFGTPTTALVFSILRTPEPPASRVVAHTGFEPVLPA